MIRLPITEHALLDRIEIVHPGWSARARERTQQSRTAGEYAEASSIWGEIKSVYMRLQSDKCAYCERLLSDGSIEHDLEHYRPKRGVAAWPPLASDLSYPFPKGDPLPEGYYLLAYHPLNYATVCKPCNTNFKSNYFPVAGSRVTRGATPADYSAEMPYLLYPIGDSDGDPEAILSFIGIVPVPNPAADKSQKRRARVVIDFFRLETREDLRRERAVALCSIDMCHRALRSGAVADEADKKAASADLAHYISPSAPHANCARCFDRLYRVNPNEARAIAREARLYLEAQRTSSQR